MSDRQGITHEKILHVLSSVKVPGENRSVVEAGLISGITVRGDAVGFLITIDPKEKDLFLPLREQCEQQVLALPGVNAATVVLTAQNAEPIPPSGGYTEPRARAQWNLTPIEGVRTIIAVGAGKGGVGKSTVSVGLAVAAARAGKRVGLLDADIYGPSIPRMLGLLACGQPEIKGGKMLPPAAHGVVCMSMGFITGDEAAVLRGPMISKTLQQMLRMTVWSRSSSEAVAHSNLDLLIIDLPPGTGDVQLSLAQQAPIAGAIVVTTPQAVSVMDARKALHMFEKLSVPVLGVVENMAGDVFGSGGGAALAAECGVPLLASLALDAKVRKELDEGKVDAAANACAPILQGMKF